MIIKKNRAFVYLTFLNYFIYLKTYKETCVKLSSYLTRKTFVCSYKKPKMFNNFKCLQIVQKQSKYFANVIVVYNFNINI